MREKQVIKIWLFSLVGAFFWNASLFAAPFLRNTAPRVSALIYAVFSPLCHQLPDRCFSFAGHPIAVCGRCFGIYFGFAVGMIFYPFIRGFKELPSLPSLRALALVSLPLLVDLSGSFFKFWSGSNTLRFVTGLLWGMILPFYWIPGLFETMALIRTKNSFSQDKRA